MALLEITSLKKSFVAPDGTKHLVLNVQNFELAERAQTAVLNVQNFELAERAQTALEGESGCGKTTFLHTIAGILKPDSGSINIAGQEMAGLNEAARDRLRVTTIGYIFQTFNLL